MHALTENNCSNPVLFTNLETHSFHPHTQILVEQICILSHLRLKLLLLIFAIFVIMHISSTWHIYVYIYITKYDVTYITKWALSKIWRFLLDWKGKWTELMQNWSGSSQAHQMITEHKQETKPPVVASSYPVKAHRQDVDCLAFEIKSGPAYWYKNEPYYKNPFYYHY